MTTVSSPAESLRAIDERRGSPSSPTIECMFPRLMLHNLHLPCVGHSERQWAANQGRTSRSHVAYPRPVRLEHVSVYAQWPTISEDCLYMDVMTRMVSQ